METALKRQTKDLTEPAQQTESLYVRGAQCDLRGFAAIRILSTAPSPPAKCDVKRPRPAAQTPLPGRFNRG